jgi:curved DNA-binding protein CbpA
MAPDSTDLYRLLQVDPAADLEVIQAAYRVLARRHHPDHSGSDEMMKQLNAAWEVLGDKSRRAEYDRKRSASASANPQPTGGSVIHAAPHAAPQATGHQTVADHAGPPVGRASGTVLTYGRYEGWSLGQIALVDPDFLEWLRSVPGGRYLRPEIDAILREARGGPRGTFNEERQRRERRWSNAGGFIG